MKKSDIKNGMHVITNGGEEWVIINNVEAQEQTQTSNTIMVRIGVDGWMPFDDYNDDLSYTSNNSGYEDYFDIKEVYAPRFYAYVTSSIYEYKGEFIKVWERPIVKKMTKAEIEAELGYKIKIVD